MGAFLLAVGLCAAPAPIVLTSVVSPAGSQSSEELAERLTSRKWQDVRTPRSGLAPETTTWEFYRDGSFRFAFISDYTQSYAGAWSVSAKSDSAGVLFLAGTVEGQGRFRRFDVLSFEFLKERLRLGEKTFREAQRTDRDAPRAIEEEARQAVAADQRDSVFSLWTGMTDANWRTETNPPTGEPAAFGFRRDGTYVARFANTVCEYSGTWSLIGTEGYRGELRLSVPANRCDPRGEHDLIVKQMPISLEGATLFVHKTKYVSVPR
jgi:hypothetical protein